MIRNRRAAGFGAILAAILVLIAGCSLSAERAAAPEPGNRAPSVTPDAVVSQPDGPAPDTAPAPPPQPVPQTDAPTGAAWGVATDPYTYAVWIHDTNGLKQVTTVAAPGHINNSYIKAARSPDGRRVAFIPDFSGTFGSHLQVVSLDGNLLLRIERFVKSFAWLPDGTGIAYTALEAVESPVPPKVFVALLRLDGSERKVASGPELDRVLGASSDGAALYMTYILDRGHQYQPESFGRLDVATGKVTPVFESGASGDFYGDFKIVATQAGSQIAFLEGSKLSTGRLVVANLDGTGKRLIRLPEGYGWFAISPSGRYIAFHREDGIWIADGDGRAAPRLLSTGQSYPWTIYSVTDQGEVWLSNTVTGFFKLTPGPQEQLPALPEWLGR